MKPEGNAAVSERRAISSIKIRRRCNISKVPRHFVSPRHKQH